jgi:phosphotriesterase-related protein
MTRTQSQDRRIEIMAKSGLEGKAQTVLGTIGGEDLGVTLTHEHLLIDGKCIFSEPEGASDRHLAYEKVAWQNLSWLRYHPYQNLDNMRLLDEAEAIDEAMLFQRAGGNTIVDVTTIGIGRDPEALARISRATGLNVIMGAGFYTGPSHSPEMTTRSEQELAREMVSDIEVGVGPYAIKAGLIGEIGCSWPLQDNERKVLRAAALAQKETGACLSVHPGRNLNAPFEVVEILQKAGAELGRVILCHTDARVRDHNERLKLLEKGCTLEYDLWGWEGHFPTYWTADGYMDLPNDTQRIYEIIKLIEKGYIDQIVLSHDICCKTRRVKYGGWGYVHLPKYAVPMMLQRGLTREQIDTIMIENPKRLLCFV